MSAVPAFVSHASSLLKPFPGERKGGVREGGGGGGGGGKHSLTYSVKHGGVWVELAHMVQHLLELHDSSPLGDCVLFQRDTVCVDATLIVSRSPPSKGMRVPVTGGSLPHDGFYKL